MAKLETQVNHSLGKEKAREQVDHMFTKVRDQYPDMVKDLEGSWTDDTLSLSFKTYGFAISFDIEVFEDKVDVRGQIPMSAVPFKGKIQATVVDKLEELLA